MAPGRPLLPRFPDSPTGAPTPWVSGLHAKWWGLQQLMKLRAEAQFEAMNRGKSRGSVAEEYHQECLIERGGAPSPADLEYLELIRTLEDRLWSILHFLWELESYFSHMDDFRTDYPNALPIELIDLTDLDDEPETPTTAFPTRAHPDARYYPPNWVFMPPPKQGVYDPDPGDFGGSPMARPYSHRLHPSVTLLPRPLDHEETKVRDTLGWPRSFPDGSVLDLEGRRGSPEALCS